MSLAEDSLSSVSTSRGAFAGQRVLIISPSAGYNRWRLGNAPPPSAAEAWADGQVEIVTMKWRHGCFYHQPSRLQLLWPYRPHAAFLISWVIQYTGNSGPVNHVALQQIRVGWGHAGNPVLSQPTTLGNCPLLVSLCYRFLFSVIFSLSLLHSGLHLILQGKTRAW